MLACSIDQLCWHWGLSCLIVDGSIFRVWSVCVGVVVRVWCRQSRSGCRGQSRVSREVKQVKLDSNVVLKVVLKVV